MSDQNSKDSLKFQWKLKFFGPSNLYLGLDYHNYSIIEKLDEIETFWIEILIAQC